MPQRLRGVGQCQVERFFSALTFDLEMLRLPDRRPGLAEEGVGYSIDEYNRDVQEQQARHGCLDTREPRGSRMRRGEWRGSV